jgi:hypothetical protein
MMEGKRRKIGSIKLRKDRPTKLTFADLHTWVIWQFPRPKGASMCGAVKPPIASHNWFPALIRQHDNQVLVHGHIDLEFSTPNAAAEWLESNGASKK